MAERCIRIYVMFPFTTVTNARIKETAIRGYGQ